jgi:GT2 family glycosyltransferase
MISFIIPSYNNLQHLKNVYTSIQKNAPETEVILLDDGSTDGTWEWMQQRETESSNKIKIVRSETRVGHTILYDKGIELAANDVVGILHADMIVGPNYVENMLKLLKPGTVVCGTRIEPPLHPEGKEKIIQNFGLDFDTLDVESFETYCIQMQEQFKDQTTKGMFAPWIIYKKDFEAVGGHDPLFAPFPYEDSDIFQRWILAGYELIQSRDAFVYHLTCRGHRWNEQVGVDDTYYKEASSRSARNYMRKWGSWIDNDEYQYPIMHPKYNIGYIVANCSSELLAILEPLCDTIYISDSWIRDLYCKQEQSNTQFCLTDRVRTYNFNDGDKPNNIIVEFDGRFISNNTIKLLQQLPQIIKETNELGQFEIDIFKITIKDLTEYQNNLIHIYK